MGSAPALCLTVLSLLCSTAGVDAAPIHPFNVTNQGPLLLPFNLPASADWRITPPGATVIELATDLANTYTVARNAREELRLDGESWRTTLRIMHGTPTGEIGLELPVMGMGGGSFDGFITGWHDFFNLPQGGRDTAPKGRLDYRYVKDGRPRLDVSASGSGLGDICFTGGRSLLRTDGSALLLRGRLSLPSGESGRLMGSGALGGALWLAGGHERPLSTGRMAAWGSLGAMLPGNGDILPDQQRRVAAFGALGAGWAPAEVIDFKLQLNANTPLYSGSDLTPIQGIGMVLTMGGSLHFSTSTALDIGVSEDIHVGTAADVALHLQLRTTWE